MLPILLVFMICVIAFLAFIIYLLSENMHNLIKASTEIFLTYFPSYYLKIILIGFLIIYIVAFINIYSSKIGFESVMRHPIMNITIYIVLFIFIIFIFYLFNSYSYNLGDEAAKDLIRGSQGNIMVFLEPIGGGNLCTMKNNSTKLILVMYNKDKYYLVEQNNTPPEHANLYIIPDNLIKKATLLTI